MSSKKCKGKRLVSFRTLSALIGSQTCRIQLRKEGYVVQFLTLLLSSRSTSSDKSRSEVDVQSKAVAVREHVTHGQELGRKAGGGVGTRGKRELACDAQAV